MISKENAFITVDPVVFPVLAFSFFIFPVKWILGWVMAIAVHECCHYIALHIFRIAVWKIHIGLLGAQMQTESMSTFAEFICALAGPLGSALLLAFSKAFPYMAICALAHCLFNLLPIRTMDGGRMCRCVLSLFLGEAPAEKACRIISVILQFLMLFFVLHLLMKRYIGIGVALPVFCLLIHFISREKHLAKREK